MKKIIIMGIIAIFFVVFLGYYFVNSKNTDEISGTVSSLEIVQNNINIGEIPMDQGKVEILFELLNTGMQDVSLGNAETSCMCTEAYTMDMSGGNKSEIIQMRGHGMTTNVNRTIKPQEKIQLVAIFDPNAHGPNAIGPISRNVYIQTNSKIIPKLDFRFMGEVVKTRTTPKTEEKEDVGISTEIFQFEETSFDFGTIQQSGGKVQHDFSFTYNGKEPISITGVPTSCACTSATIDKTHFQPGERGILTVKFNPNLHAEPEGRFFKTVSILTDRELEKIPEVKIWTEINLDLGEDAFELKSTHVDDHDDEHDGENSYHSITSEEFDKMVKDKNFFLVDTHIPEQEHILGTDAFIPYNEIENNIDSLPENKNAKIVVYCRSGSMSRAAAYTLAEKGYTSVYDLVGGKIAYDMYKN